MVQAGGSDTQIQSLHSAHAEMIGGGRHAVGRRQRRGSTTPERSDFRIEGRSSDLHKVQACSIYDSLGRPARPKIDPYRWPVLL